MALVSGRYSSSGPRLVRAPCEAWLASGRVPAPSPLLEGGEPLRAAPAAPVVEDGMGRELEFEHGRSVVCRELFQEAMGAMNRLGEELVGVDTRLECPHYPRKQRDSSRASPSAT